MLAKRFAHRLKSSDISVHMYSPQILINYFIHRIGTLTVPVDNSFILDFKHNILNKNAVHPEFTLIEKCRSELCQNTRELDIVNLGAGTRFGRKHQKISRMASVASVSPKYGKLLYHMASYYKPDCIIELGTALGISTMYLAMGNPQAKVITIESNPQLTAIASRNFAANNLKNITIINSTFENAITQLTPKLNTNTLVFIDGNHTFKATLQYFKVFGKATDSLKIIVFDDINWSHEMMQAWKFITKSANTAIKVDLFQMGILFQGRGNDPHVYRLRL